MGPASKIDSLDVDQSHEGFMDEGGRTQGMVRALAAQTKSCQPSELVVDEGHETVQGCTVTRSPILKQTRDFPSGIHLALILVGAGE